MNGNLLLQSVAERYIVLKGKSSYPRQFQFSKTTGEGSSKHILDTELETIKRIRSNYPLLAKVPIFNDEGDPLVGWSRPQWWRADTTYAAVVTKVIIQHQHLLITPNPNYLYTLISNDNGFLNFYPTFFEQRTLNTRFQMNNTKPNSVQLIKKPVLAVMGLLARLGDRLVYVEDLKKTETTDLGMLATLEFVNTSWSAAVLISNSADTSLFTGLDEISLNVSGIPEVGSYIYVVYLLDREHGNPHRVWLLQGKPIFPTKEQFDEMRTHQEAVRVQGPTDFTQKDLALKLALKKPGIMLVHMCQKSSAPPGKVHNVTLYQVTSSDLLVTWSDSYIATPCILTFELEHSTQSEGGPYTRVNKNDITFTSFVYSTEASETIQGWYRVRAVDYWMRGGVYSNVIHYTA
ncbi:Alpha-L-iduronidase [Holothuria leucospilota]|uniref:Alpha-L-iduronidase n=1 Tax=Holothuria leucospilota TaxID=206669 RepID=A0A9Q1C5S4_HOLLE|nr:Alpha-L-iduronidase [Holothuria leucospilota]